MLFILTRPWHHFRTRNVWMCLRPVFSRCPPKHTGTVSQCPFDGQKRDVANDVKNVRWCQDQTDLTITKTRQSAMVKGSGMSQLMPIFDQGVNFRRVCNSLTQFAWSDLIFCRKRQWRYHTRQPWSPIVEDSGAVTHQPWSPITEDSDAFTRQSWSPDEGYHDAVTISQSKQSSNYASVLNWPIGAVECPPLEHLFVFRCFFIAGAFLAVARDGNGFQIFLI